MFIKYTQNSILYIFLNKYKWKQYPRVTFKIFVQNNTRNININAFNKTNNWTSYKSIHFLEGDWETLETDKLAAFNFSSLKSDLKSKLHNSFY